jgi:hypothetical protein
MPRAYKRQIEASPSETATGNRPEGLDALNRVGRIQIHALKLHITSVALDLGSIVLG